MYLYNLSQIHAFSILHNAKNVKYSFKWKQESQPKKNTRCLPANEVQKSYVCGTPLSCLWYSTLTDICYHCRMWKMTIDWWGMNISGNQAAMMNFYMKSRSPEMWRPVDYLYFPWKYRLSTDLHVSGVHKAIWFQTSPNNRLSQHGAWFATMAPPCPQTVLQGWNSICRHNQDIS